MTGMTRDAAPCPGLEVRRAKYAERLAEQSQRVKRQYDRSDSLKLGVRLRNHPGRRGDALGNGGR
jgi:hypothetical protein